MICFVRLLISLLIKRKRSHASTLGKLGNEFLMLFDTINVFLMGRTQVEPVGAVAISGVNATL